MTASAPTPARLAGIDRLAERLRADSADPAAIASLWGAVLRLDRWYFIARGPEASPSPYVAQLRSGSMLFAFTSPERAAIGARNANLTEQEAARQLSVPLPRAVEWAASFTAAGVKGIVFDTPAQSYWVPLANLVGLRDRLQ
ncbi:MAG: hypothetical protein ABW204_04070 [Microbacteriaceae bacterium]|jgi:hypothetical protein